MNDPSPDTGITVFDRSHRFRLSASQKNQIHLAVKSLYRYLSGVDAVQFGVSSSSTRHAGMVGYQPFFDHINQRRSVRQKDRYLSGDLTRAQKKITDKRLQPEDVLTLIQHCHLMRDAFLITLLYNTGIRIGEALDCTTATSILRNTPSGSCRGAITRTAPAPRAAKHAAFR